jgi:hypothetical protein
MMTVVFREEDHTIGNILKEVICKMWVYLFFRLLLSGCILMFCITLGMASNSVDIMCHTPWLVSLPFTEFAF